jgi:hypothetical protein
MFYTHIEEGNKRFVKLKLLEILIHYVHECPLEFKFKKQCDSQIPFFTLSL